MVWYRRKFPHGDDATGSHPGQYKSSDATAQKAVRGPQIPTAKAKGSLPQTEFAQEADWE